MKIKGLLLAMCMAFMLLSCGSSSREVYREAQQNLEKGRYEQALEGYKEAVDNNVNVEESWRGQGIALLRLNRYDEAIQAFDTALSRKGIGNAFQKDIWTYRATAQYKNGDIEGAVESCSTALTFGKDSQVSLLLGNLQLEQAQYEQAKASFDEVTSQFPEYDSYINVYQIYGEHDMIADGQEYLEQALSIDGNSSEDHYQRGRIHFYLENYEQARNELIEAVNAGHENAQIFLGSVYLATGASATAREIYQQYIQESDYDGKGYNGLALCDINDEKYDDALTNISKGLEVAQTDEVQDLMYNEIVAYEKKLDFTTALSKMEEYLAIYPDDQQAQREYVFLQSR